MVMKADYRSCGAYNEEGTGVILLNPFRLRGPENVADTLLQAASQRPSRLAAREPAGLGTCGKTVLSRLENPDSVCNG